MASGIDATLPRALPSLPGNILRTLLDPGVVLWNLYDQISQARPADVAPLHASPSLRASPVQEHGADDIPGQAEDEISVQFHNMPPGARVSTRASGATLHVSGAAHTAAHKIVGTLETHGMSKDSRADTLDAQMTALGAARNMDGTYSLDRDTITFDNRYVLDKPKIDAHGGSVWDPDTAHYFDTLEQERAFLADPRNSGYGEVGAMSPLNSRKTTLYAGSVDSGYSSGTVRFNYYTDDAGDIGTYALPLSQNLAEDIYHEIGHAVYGDAAEEAADTWGLEKLNLAGPTVIDPPPHAAQRPTLNTIVHKIKGSAEVHGMTPGARERALDDQMTALGATGNPDGSYTLDKDTITLDDRYVVDIPKVTKDKGSEFDPSTAHYFKSLEEQTAFLYNNRDKHYQEVGADSKLNSHKTTLFAGSIDPGYTDGTVSIDYKDDAGQTRTTALPLARNLEEHLRHEIGHAVYGDAAEIDADTRALKNMNLVGAPDAGRGEGGVPPPPPPPSTHASASGPSATTQADSGETSSFQTIPLNGVQTQFRVMLPSETGGSRIGDLDEVTNSVQQLPDYITGNLVKNGAQWVVVPDSPDQAFTDEDNKKYRDNQDLLRHEPGGWNDGETNNAQNNANDGKLDWGDADSQYNPQRKWVIIGTRHGLPEGDGSIDVTKHETGHAYDYLNGFPSHQDDFKKAYDLDKPNMTTDNEATATNPTDRYYLQSGYSGREETFAEGFARYYFRDANHKGDDTFQKDWPHVYDYFVKFDAARKAEAQAKSAK